MDRFRLGVSFALGDVVLDGEFGDLLSLLSAGVVMVGGGKCYLFIILFIECYDFRFGVQCFSLTRGEGMPSVGSSGGSVEVSVI